MATLTDIFNMALIRTGVSRSIADPNENSNEARICRIMWPSVRDNALRDVDWNFARKRVKLALTGDPAPTNWGYAYALPSDWLAVRKLVVVGDRTPVGALKVPYEIAGGVLFTDLEEAELIYTARIEDVGLFDAQAVNAMSWALVPELALGLVIKGDWATIGKRGYQEAISSAIAANLQEGDDLDPDSEFVTVR